ncbi:MAG: CheR family methyltransferase [Pseudotabrizicola sp.]|uniref:CheR family methyltransferase n=1 Tax=Pseudotabrizicola sp. TaxID=2939647 RepID=UPI00271B767C|nr:CheR family methyltransferase [Pseudotabrizicola sp.]MDO9638352.1 CheR family methyltransferase [Pseudotabrizicola sp.]
MMGGTIQQVRITPDQAQILVEAVFRLSGISVAATKTDFLEHRINRLLRESGVGTVNEYVEHLRTAPAGPAALRLVEALTTHTTSFFREKAHFDWLAASGLPSVLAEGAGRDRPLTIWSAACSTGAELWTAGMVLDTFARNRSLRWDLVGTDVSQKILSKAAAATFDEDDILPIPDEMRRRYLLRSRSPVGGKPRYRIAPELRSRARLAWANLLDLPSNMTLTADIAFLRNVLIYFEPDDQLRAAAQVARRIRPGGYLLTGHSEGLASPPPGMTLVSPSIYRKE